MPKNQTKDPAWGYCEPSARDGYVSCNLCKGQVSLGPNEKNRSIGSFKKHIKNRHFALWNELYSAENDDAPTSGKKRKNEDTIDDEDLPTSANTKKARKAIFQSTLPQVLEASQPMPFHSEKSLHLHKILFEYLVSDCVPWNAVNGPGFQRLCHELNPRFQVASHSYYASQLEPTFVYQ